MIDPYDTFITFPPELLLVTQCWVDALNRALWQELVPASFRIYTGEHCRTENFTLVKFHTVKNWYQFLTAREKMVPIRHVFHTNVLYFVKNAHIVKFYV